MKFKEKIYLTYDDTLSMMKNLEYEVSKMRPDLIALHLSHALDVPLECMHWSTRDSGMQTYSGPVEEELQAGRTVVFVDDINDTGLTFYQIKMEYGNEGTSKFVSLIEKTSSKFKTDARALRMDDERWIVFPWEKD
jgi:hypoxanthine phosphoribosyltransferase